MTMCELATAAIHKLPIKIMVLNNHYLGMVRQWQEHVLRRPQERRGPGGQSGLREAGRVLSG
jgi:thiamine pyrophosphate-dependent acetolactate synthase large subunit-like protein